MQSTSIMIWAYEASPFPIDKSYFNLSYQKRSTIARNDTILLDREAAACAYVLNVLFRRSDSVQETVLVITEQLHTEALPDQAAIQRAVALWLTKELNKPHQ